MTSRRRVQGVGLLAVTLAAVHATSPALGSAPYPATSSIPDTIVLSDARGAMCQPLAIRSISSNPSAEAVLTFDFSACPADLQICTLQPDQRGLQIQPAVVSCGGRVITVSADYIGQLCIAFVGQSTRSGGFGPLVSERTRCCTVY